MTTRCPAPPHLIGHPRAVLVLDRVEQGGNVAAPDGREGAITPERQHVLFKHALKLPPVRSPWPRRGA